MSVDKFYEPGDCFVELKMANGQRANKLKWREQLQIAAWNETRRNLIEAINNLWRHEGSWVAFYEEDWFPGYEDFLEDLQKMGYHVFLQVEEAMNNPVSRFAITLDYTGGLEQWVEWQRPRKKRLVKELSRHAGSNR